MDDPEVVLAQLREVVGRVGAEGGDAGRLAELFGWLDGWLTRGNYLPSDWVPPEWR